jgi:hypothetical protein
MRTLLYHFAVSYCTGVWTRRVTHLLLAVPFALAAAALGYVAAILWGLPEWSVGAAIFTAGGFSVCCAWDWFQEWRRG